MKWNVAIFIFDDVEVLDFCGPFEVFSVTSRLHDDEPFNVFTVAATAAPIRARGGMQVIPSYSFDNCPTPNILIVPGGHGTRALLDDRHVLSWIKKQHTQSEFTLTVCTGALLLAKTGLLEGLEATTHHLSFDLLSQLTPTTRVNRRARFIDSGKIVTSAGISAGIDMSLHMVALLLGFEQARETANHMEYRWLELANTIHQ